MCVCVLSLLPCINSIRQKQVHPSYKEVGVFAQCFIFFVFGGKVCLWVCVCSMTSYLSPFLPLFLLISNVRSLREFEILKLNSVCVRKWDAIRKAHITEDLAFHVCDSLALCMCVFVCVFVLLGKGGGRRRGTRRKKVSLE